MMKKITWEDRVYFSLYFTITTIINQSNSKQEHKQAETWRQELIQRLQRFVTYWLASDDCLVCFLIEPRCSRLAPPNGLGLWSPLSDYENALCASQHPYLIETWLNWDYLISDALNIFQVVINIKLPSTVSNHHPNP